MPNKKGTRLRTCDCCAKQELVRSDNASTTCMSCNARKRAAKGNAVRRIGEVA